MFIVIRFGMRPSPLLRRPLQHIFNHCVDDFSQRRLSLFSTSDLALQFIQEQRKLQEQQYFLMLALENWRQSLLRQIFIQRDIGQFYLGTPRLTYFSPLSPARRLHYHPHRDALRDEDRAFIAAQDASMRSQQEASSGLPLTTLKSAADFPKKETLPDDFSLQESQQTDIKNNKFSDPITLEDMTLTNDKCLLACVPSNGKYFIFDPNSVYDLVKRSKDGKTFQNPITRAEVNIKDVFVIPAKAVVDHVNQAASVARPSRSM